jgi:hypothetical protein
MYGSSKTILATSFETPYKEGGNTDDNTFKGWFLAPETTKYRFYAACNDKCSLSFSQTANGDPSTAV